MRLENKLAKRIKLAQSMTGYTTRKAFSSKFDISPSTLEAWERGKNPLTLKGAQRIINALRSVGVYCSEEWLMEGKGFSPRPLKELSEELNINSDSLSMLEKNLNIAKELSTFTTLNEGAMVTLVRDDAMLPFYENGDYVGGIKLKGAAIQKALNKRCIIELPNEKVTVRELREGADIFHYNLSTTNLKTKKMPMTQYNVEITSAAPIIWHRANDK